VRQKGGGAPGSAPRPEVRSPCAEGDPAPTAGSMAGGSALPRVCVPAVWAAAALLLSVSWTSGRTLRVRSVRRRWARGSALPPPLGPRPPRRRLSSRAWGARQDRPPRARRQPGPHALARAPGSQGLVPMSRALGTAKCFQRPAVGGGGSPSPGLSEGRQKASVRL
jgi:hypothetical protein